MARSRVHESDAEIAAQIEAAVKEQERAQLEAAVDMTAEGMRDLAISFTPEDTGRAKSSFEIDKGERDGLPTRTLKNTDPIFNLIEYGSIHNEESAPLRRAAEAYEGGG